MDELFSRSTLIALFLGEPNLRRLARLHLYLYL
jgi:hypothetical protein